MHDCDRHVNTCKQSEAVTVASQEDITMKCEESMWSVPTGIGPIPPNSLRWPHECCGRVNMCAAHES
jgi:hypothetical protein